ncbi:hypothetical protein ACOMHN_014819 [Nucella lapillus]
MSTDVEGNVSPPKEPPPEKKEKKEPKAPKGKGGKGKKKRKKKKQLTPPPEIEEPPKILTRVELRSFLMTDIHMVYRHLPPAHHHCPYVYFIRTTEEAVPAPAPRPKDDDGEKKHGEEEEEEEKIEWEETLSEHLEWGVNHANVFSVMEHLLELVYTPLLMYSVHTRFETSPSMTPTRMDSDTDKPSNKRIMVKSSKSEVDSTSQNTGVVAIDGGARMQQTALESAVGCREAGNVAHGDGGIRQSVCKPSSCVEVDSEDHCPWEEGGSADDICANRGTSTDEGTRDAGEEAQGGCRVEAAGVAGGRLCHRR